MNFNDLLERINLIELEIFETSNIPINFNWDINENHEIYNIQFTNRTFSNTEINIFTIILSISTLKDLIIKKMKLINLESYIFESYINNDLLLCVLMDLNNKLKHGEPLNKNRSKLDVKICNAVDGVRYNIRENSFISYIHADILDEKGNLICTFSNLIKHSIMMIKNFIKEYKL